MTPEESDTLHRTLSRMPRPGKALTRREIAVLQQVARGLSNEAIGRELFYAPGTVKVMMLRIFRKLEASNRAAAVDRGWRLGYLSAEPYAGAALHRRPRPGGPPSV